MPLQAPIEDSNVRSINIQHATPDTRHATLKGMIRSIDCALVGMTLLPCFFSVFIVLRMVFFP